MCNLSHNGAHWKREKIQKYNTAEKKSLYFAGSRSLRWTIRYKFMLHISRCFVTYWVSSTHVLVPWLWRAQSLVLRCGLSVVVTIVISSLYELCREFSTAVICFSPFLPIFYCPQWRHINSLRWNRHYWCTWRWLRFDYIRRPFDSTLPETQQSIFALL